ncbi:lipase [Rhodococcus phage ReqiPine5]|uniref:Gp21 n=1 Tax=Rhodococcus phage ReqiPine5 TaxID=691963 RepID=D4P7Z6_9CAUD|nr:lipase [Rhodococcus phage ReqiPine5]ADD81126.1 gp21 [Rhodococcus phage ReqiPine5]
MPYIRPYPNGYKDFPDKTTPVTGAVLNAMDDALERLDRVAPYRPTFVTLGDSRTQYNGKVIVPAGSTGAIAKDNRGYVTRAMIELGQPLTWLENGGVGGDTVAMMLARTDGLLAYDPGFLIGFGAINSVNNGVSSETIISELTQIFDKAAAKGTTVIWGTDWISPGTEEAEKPVAAGVNAWLRGLALVRPDFYLVDYARVMSDPTSGFVPVSLGADQLHQDAPGGAVMGKALADVLRPLVTPRAQLPTSNADTRNLVANGLFTGDASGLATGWGKGSAAASVHSKVVRTDGVPGEWQQVVCTAETATSLTRQTVLSTTDLVVGDKVFAVIEFECDEAGWDATEFTLQLQTIGGAAGSPTVPKIVNDNALAAVSPLPAPVIRKGILRTPNLPIIDGATHLQVSVRLRGSGTYRVARVGVYRA